MIDRSINLGSSPVPARGPHSVTVEAAPIGAAMPPRLVVVCCNRYKAAPNKQPRASRADNC